ncbi:MAG TPA: sigma-54 dependent transcriptional regulator, partial [Polyangiales bacterium]
MNKVLVIEDDEAVRCNILDLLEAEGFEGLGAPDGRQGIALALQRLPDLVICDVGMPGIDGFEVFEILSQSATTAALPFVFLSARAERSDVRRGMTLGADDYLTKPFTRAELLDTIRVRLNRRQPSKPASRSPRRPENPGAEGEALVIQDGRMRALVSQIERVARGSISVLVLGETGVGKERIAEEIHRRSGRPGRFVAINCGAISETLLESELFGHEKGAFTSAHSAKEGLLETSHTGTLFLDEVGELPPSMQVKLLRVLEEHEVLRVGARSPRSVDLRVVSATNRDLEREVERGSFRADLFYRLNGVVLEVPALRERKQDIRALSDGFARSAAQALGRMRAPVLSPTTHEALGAYAWPGNIRELRNVMERAVL